MVNKVVGKGNDQVSITTKFEERLDTGTWDQYYACICNLYNCTCVYNYVYCILVICFFVIVCILFFFLLLFLILFNHSCRS